MPDSSANASASMPSPKQTAPTAGHGIGRVRRVDPPHRPPPPADGDEDGQRRQRLERPAEHRLATVGGSVGTGPWAGRRDAARASASGQAGRRWPAPDADGSVGSSAAIVPRTAPGTPRRRDARTACSGYHGRGPAAGGPAATFPHRPRPQLAATTDHPLRTCMASSPGRAAPPPRYRPARRRPLIAGDRRARPAASILGQRAGDHRRPVPARGRHEPGREIRDLYTIVFLIAVVDLLRRRGPDRLDGPPLSAQARRRRACPPRPTATPSPRSSGPSSRRSSWPSCSSSRGRPSTSSRPCRPTPDHRSGRSPASSSGRSSTSRRLGAADRSLHAASLHRIRRSARGPTGGLAVPAGESVQLYLTARTSSTPSTSRSSCSSATSCRAGPTSSSSTSTPDAGQTFHGQCAELCGAGHRVMLFDVHGHGAGRVRCLAAGQIDKAERDPPPAPPVSRRLRRAGSASPAAGWRGPSRAVAKNIAFDQTDADRPGRHAVQDRLRQPGRAVPHNVAIHEGSPTGPARVQRARSSRGSPSRPTTSRPWRPATYAFVCTVHPNMTGTLTVN